MVTQTSRWSRCQRCGGSAFNGECISCGYEEVGWYERHLFLEYHRGDITRDLADLGRRGTCEKWQIHPNQLYRLIKRWGLDQYRMSRATAGQLGGISTHMRYGTRYMRHIGTKPREGLMSLREAVLSVNNKKEESPNGLKGMKGLFKQRSKELIVSEVGGSCS